MTFATRLAGRRKRIGFFVHFWGVGRVFKSHPGIDASAILGATYDESTGLTADLFTLGEESVDTVAMCVKGGGLDLSIAEKHGSTVLRDLILPRKRKTTHVAADLTKIATTISVGDNTWATNGQTIYIGHETIIVGTKAGSTTFNGCTRGAFGSRAQAHEAATSLDGAAVYDVVPAWRGRRITLWMCFLDDSDACADATLASRIGTYSIDDTPTLTGKRLWSIKASPLSDEYARRKLYVGLKKIELDGGIELVPASGDPTYSVSPVPDFRQFTPGADWVTHVIAELSWLGEDAGALIFMVDSVVDVDQEIKLVFEPGLISPRGTGGEGDPILRREVKSLTPLAIAGSIGSGAGLLIFLTSVDGDGANGSSDRLPGFRPNTFNGHAVRFGAGIDEDDIDVAAFSVNSRLWSLPLSASISAGEVIKDWCLAADMWATTDSLGRLSAIPASVVSGATAGTIDESMILAPDTVSVSAAEGEIYPSVRVLANWSPLSSRYLFDATLTDHELSQRYPHSDETLEIESKGIGVEVTAQEKPYHYVRPWPFSMTQDELVTWMRGRSVRAGRPACIVTLSCRLSALSLRVGDLVTLDLPGYVDFEGGNLEGRPARIIGRRPRIKDGAIDFTIEIADIVFAVAPSAQIDTAPTTVLVANDTIKLKNSADASGANPEDDFDIVGMSVRMWDVSAGTSQVLVVAEKLSGNRIRFTTGITGTPEPDRDYITWDTLGSNTGLGSTTSGYGEEDLLFQMPDDPTAPAAGEVRRWR